MRRFFFIFGITVAALSMSGCSSLFVDSIPTWAGGEPAGTPERPAAQPEYPPVNERPPSRSTTVITEDEQGRIERELTAARNAQAARAKEVQEDRDGMLANTPQPPPKRY